MADQWRIRHLVETSEQLVRLRLGYPSGVSIAYCVAPLQLSFPLRLCLSGQQLLSTDGGTVMTDASVVDLDAVTASFRSPGEAAEHPPRRRALT